jgi:queuine tRNA-ribosyltransferase
MQPVTFSIEKEHKGSRARAGALRTPHGHILTPAFVAVGTKADVKAIDSTQYQSLGIQTVIANTYHLYLSPGEELIAKAGGIHRFMGTSLPVMTDSGGFQVFSLGEGFGKKISKFTPEDASTQEGVALFDEDLATSHGKLAIIDDDGVTFTSHIDGSLHRFTPERSVEIQHKLGADIFFAFDQCTAPTASYEFQKEAMERTHAWAKRSLAAHRQNFEASQKQAIYGIAQGGQFDELRKESARTIGEMGFDGFGLGGSFSKKYGENSLQSALAMLQELPHGMPVHGLGVGEPEDILLGIEHGVDTFDCVIPTRNGRNGGLFTMEGKIQIPNAEYKEDFGPIDEDCDCVVCVKNTSGEPTHSRAYIHHLFRTHEMLGQILASQHNIRFLTRLCDQARESILNDSFAEFKEAFLQKYQK